MDQVSIKAEHTNLRFKDHLLVFDHLLFIFSWMRKIRSLTIYISEIENLISKTVDFTLKSEIRLQIFIIKS